MRPRFAGQLGFMPLAAVVLLWVSYGMHPSSEAGRLLTVDPAYAEDAGIEFGSVLDVVGVVDSLVSDLYNGFSTSYIDKYYGGSVAGYLLGMLLDPDQAEFDYIENQLDVMNQKLNHLIALDGQILTAIGRLEKEIAIDTTKIQEAISANDLVSAESNLNSYTGSALLTKFSNTTLKDITAADRTYINNTCQAILKGSPTNPLSGDVDNWLTTINSHMTAAGPFNAGLIQLLATQVHEQTNGTGANLYRYYQWMESYFLRYILVQSKGMNLYVECARALPVPLAGSAITAQYLTYVGNIVQQFKTFRNAVEETLMLSTGYPIVTAAFNPQTASTTGTAFLFPSAAGLILARVDYLTDRVLGETNFEALATELNGGSASFLNRPRGALTARILSAEDQYATGYQLTFNEKGSPPYTSLGTGTASAFSGLPYVTWEEQAITGNNNAYRLIRYEFPNVPLGNYEVTGPSGTNLLEGLDMNPDGVQVVPYDRQFNRLTAASKDVVMATSQTLASWETFTLEDYRLSGQYDAALGKLKAANGNYVVRDSRNKLVADSATGQDISFVGWTKNAPPEAIVNWGYLSIGGSYVQVTGSPPTQQIAFVDQITGGTKFKITFIDKGKQPLEPGQSYQVSLAYGIADDESPVTCSHFVTPPGPCVQYYLFANVGYPYGYFTDAPVAAAGGFGKTSWAGPGGSPLLWKFVEETNFVSGMCDADGAQASAGELSGQSGLWAEIKTSSSAHEFGPATCMTAGVLVDNTTTLQLADPQCEYQFALSIDANLTPDFQWNGADSDKLTDAVAFLNFDRINSDGNEVGIKSLTRQAKSAAGTLWVASAGLSYSQGTSGNWDHKNNAYIRYGLKLVYKDPLVVIPSLPIFKLTLSPVSVGLNLTGISCPAGETDRQRAAGSDSNK